MKTKIIINDGKYIVENNGKYTIIIPYHSNYGIIRNKNREIVKFYTYDKDEMDRLLEFYGFKMTKEA